MIQFLRLRFLIPLFVASVCTASSQAAQAQPPSPPSQTTSQAASTTADPVTLQKEGMQALTFITQREILDPAAIVPDIGKPLAQNGAWLVGKQRPASCPPTTDNCVRIIYRVSEAKVSCEWVVLLKPDGVHGTILEQNPDSIRYMLRNLLPTEAAAQVLSRALPPIARTSGDVDIQVIVSPTGEPIRAIVISGPPQLRAVSLATAKQWIFKPLTVANRAIPYQMDIHFLYDRAVVKAVP